ncbi:MAG TPA: hypothetical protein VKU89_11360 [Solirubrobacteraceae bacterium]|nr:hypothetical protein [Solirubrobacteraceae bacterium]
MDVLPFWLSIGVLSLLQGATVALVRIPQALHARIGRPRAAFAAIPALSVLLFVVAVRAFAQSAEALTYLALIAVPLLAGVAIVMLGGRRLAALLACALFALAWVGRGSPAAQLAGGALDALSCAALGGLLALLAPRRALALGIYAMAAVDTTLIIVEELQRPNSVLNAVRPPAQLPRLQAEAFGSAVMGYGDLLVAGVLGGLLVLHFGGAAQLRGAIAVAVLALLFDLLFFVVHELPATVPVAGALALHDAWRMRSARAVARSAPARSPAH